MNIEDIREFVKHKHFNQKRKQGTPYYLHPYAVLDLLKEKGFSKEYQIIALCHDLLEDTNTTYEELSSVTSSKVADIVVLLTKEDNYDMTDYIKRISLNEAAKTVKLADRVCNLREVVFADFKFINKYVSETKEWYIDLAKDTLFEKEMREIIVNLDNNY